MTRAKAFLAACVLTTSLAGAPVLAQGKEHETGESADEAAKRAGAMNEAFALAGVWLDTRRRYDRIPALSVAVVKGDETVWARGFGHSDRKRTQPATADTIYSICSISKLFTAVAFMQQWERGAVRLDEPVATYLPWAQLAADERDSVPVTMRGLLTHSAGLPREAVNPYWTGPDFPFPTQAEIRAGISGQDPLYPAARTFQYSNLGLTLVGETVEAVTGTDFGDYVTANVLAPLGMDDTRPFIPADLHGKAMAVGWGALRPDGTRPTVKLFDARGINPAAGFSASVNDLAKFARWQFRLLKTEEPELLRASTLREMHRVHYITPDRETSWGLGFANYQLNGHEVVGHGGSCPGYRSALMLDPKNELGIALAMNAMDNPGRYARSLGSVLLSRFEAAPFDAPDGQAIDLGAYAGVYDSQPWGPDFAIVEWAGGLAMVETSDADPVDSLVRLKPLGADRFRIVNRKGEERDIVTFVRKRDGSVAHLERFGNRSRFLRPLD